MDRRKAIRNLVRSNRVPIQVFPASLDSSGTYPLIKMTEKTGRAQQKRNSRFRRERGKIPPAAQSPCVIRLGLYSTRDCQEGSRLLQLTLYSAS